MDEHSFSFFDNSSFEMNVIPCRRILFGCSVASARYEASALRNTLALFRIRGRVCMTGPISFRPNSTLADQKQASQTKGTLGHQYHYYSRKDISSGGILTTMTSASSSYPLQWNDRDDQINRVCGSFEQNVSNCTIHRRVHALTARCFMTLTDHSPACFGPVYGYFLTLPLPIHGSERLHTGKTTMNDL